MTTDLPIEKLQVERVPYLLVRLDWLETALRWLTWGQSQMSPASVSLVDGGTTVELTEWLRRCVEELEELRRVGEVVRKSSPLIFMRQMPAPDDLEQHAMVPPMAGERGN